MIKTVFGIDPGKNIGFARFDVQDKVIKHKSETIMDFDLFCVVMNSVSIMAQERNSPEPIIIVMEDFLLFAHKAKNQIGSRMDASQVIGVVKYLVKTSNGRLVLVMQQPSINLTAAKYSGHGLAILNRGGHLPDDISASNHAHYWLVENKFLKHRMFDE